MEALNRYRIEYFNKVALRWEYACTQTYLEQAEKMMSTLRGLGFEVRLIDRQQ